MQNIDLENRLSSLETLDRAGLITEWQSLSNKPLPKKMSIGTLRLLVAYTIQAQAYPKAVARIERRLAPLIRQRREKKTPPAEPVRKAPAGTRLIRAWKGETHEVIVREDGFTWKDQTYLSLSEIARSITGTRWNGPRFFGLRDAG
jgi:hypothetical protein